jgi:predicted phosphodiesterase
MKTRIIIPDSHGAHIDWPAAEAFLADAKAVDPDEIVLLGDHLDAGGTFNSHQRTYTNEFTESYEEDCIQANLFLDRLQAACPKAKEIHYLEGNHEQHVERWAARNFQSHRDADMFLERMGPAAALRLKDRGIHYYRRSVFYQGLAIPGCIQLGKCFFVHGISHAKHADAVHLQRFGASVVFGHIHRSMGRIERTVTSGGHGAWCPGTLAKLQPLYKHTAPSDWSHGYAVQEVLASGQFHHTNVPIFGDRTIASIRRGAPEPVQSGAYSVQVDPKRQAKTVEAAVSQATRRAAREAARTQAVLDSIKPKTGPSKAECVRALKKHGTQLAAANALGIHKASFRRRLGVD